MAIRSHIVIAVGMMSLLLCGFIQAGYAGPTKGLVAYFPFNENPYDESGYKNDGVVYGAALTADRFDRPYSAYSFNYGDRISVPASKLLEPTKEITLAAWIYAEDRALNRCSRIIRKASSKGPGYYLSWSQSTDGNGMVQLRLDGVNYIHLGISNAALVGAWHHIAATYSTVTRQAVLYVDGYPVSKMSNLYYAFQHSDTTLYIGNAMVGYNEYFPGQIDSVRIYDRAFSASEIKKLYYTND